MGMSPDKMTGDSMSGALGGAGAPSGLSQPDVSAQAGGVSQPPGGNDDIMNMLKTLMDKGGGGA